MMNDNDLIGIIHFESFAEIVLAMTLVQDSQVRKTIYEYIIPKQSYGVRNSNIWNGKLLSYKNSTKF